MFLLPLFLGPQRGTVPPTDKTFSYRFPHAAITVDSVILRFDWPQAKVTIPEGELRPGPALQILLVRRSLESTPGEYPEPFPGQWALPGGYVKIGQETPCQAVRRVIKEECRLESIDLEQFHISAEPDRDPREFNISFAYLWLLRSDDHPQPVRELKAGKLETAWYPLHAIPEEIAFDHRSIIAAAIERLRERFRREPSGRGLLPPLFTMRMMFDLYTYLLCTDFSSTMTKGESQDSGVQPRPVSNTDNGRVNHLAAFRKLITADNVHFSYRVVPFNLDDPVVAPDDAALRQMAERTLEKIAEERSQVGPKDRNLYRFEKVSPPISDDRSGGRLFNLIW
jgi:8-oxo-dGTP diphosphatase